MFNNFENDEQTAIGGPPVAPMGDGNLRTDLTTRPNNQPVLPSYISYPGNTLPPPAPPLVRESAARERMRRRRVVSRRKGGEWAWVVIAAAMLGVVVISSMAIFLLLRTSQTEQEIIPTAVAALPTAVDVRSDFSGLAGVGGSGQQVILEDGRSIVLEPWNGTSRFTVLVMGLDRRPDETGLAYRTDTMMLVSIDPATQSLGILSIPRDLYVEVPGYGQLQRVNSAMVLGELRQPEFGPQLAMQTVQYNLGMRVHDYLAVDFNTFITFVDSIGGIDVDVPYNINDPQYPNMYYGYDPLFIRAGFQHFDGTMALKYARTRHTSNDFDRARRQQDVLYAIRDRILDLDMLPQLIVQSPSLWREVNDGISTGLSLEQMIHLALYLKEVPVENIRTGVIDSNYIIGYMTPQGASVLVPNRERIGSLMVEVFGQNYSG